MKRLLGLLLLLLIFRHSGAGTLAQEVEDEREFDYVKGSEKGPKHWGKLKREWRACSNGRLQSPIDLSDRRVKVIPNLGDFKRSYKLSNATLKNRGHDIMVEWEGDAGSIQIHGTKYMLRQGHWHSPSEHSINGRRYELELHMVHETTDPTVKNKIAVVGRLYKKGQPNEFLSKMMSNMSSLPDTHAERKVGLIHPGDIKMGGRKYYKYLGSLTVPPCTEGVTWIINKKMRTVSGKQVKQLRSAVHDFAEQNARPIQAANQREVRLYGPRRHA